MSATRARLVVLTLALVALLAAALLASPSASAGVSSATAAQAFTLTGTWSNGTVEGPGEKWSRTAGSTATATVDMHQPGGRITLRGYTSPGMGYAQLALTTQSGRVLTDLYRSTSGARDWYTTPDLMPGRYQIKVTVLNQRNPSASNVGVSLTFIRASNGDILSPSTGTPITTAPATTTSAAPTTSPSGDIPPGGMFPLIGPDQPLPSGADCAARVQRNPWEPRPENTTANQTKPTGPAPYGMTTWFTAKADSSAYRGRVDGNFTGTTDEIIQWASCKWGFPTDLDRAQAVSETTWAQAFVGDNGESFGLYQMKRTVWGGYPNSQNSTAFNVDWALGLRRACYDGAEWYPELRGNLDACIGVHYSGDPDESTWRWYTDEVRGYEQSKPWLSWSSCCGGQPPTATRQ